MEVVSVILLTHLRKYLTPSGLEGLDSLGKCDRDYLGLVLRLSSASALGSASRPGPEDGEARRTGRSPPGVLRGSALRLG
jgi:hypothetical protein